MTKRLPRDRRGEARSKKRSKTRLLAFEVGEGPANVARWSKELQEMTNVLLGRAEPPIQEGVSTLLEVADGYFARASEMAMQIHRLERQGQVEPGDSAYKFRTGELDKFLAMARKRADVGSRRITVESQIIDAARTGRSKHTDNDWND